MLYDSRAYLHHILSEDSLPMSSFLQVKGEIYGA